MDIVSLIIFNMESIDKLILKKIVDTPDIIDGHLNNLRNLLKIPTNLDEMDEIIDLHMQEFRQPHVQEIRPARVVPVIKRAPHFINEEYIYI